MKLCLSILLSVFLSGGSLVQGEEAAESPKFKPDYAHLVTKDGTEYFDCFVKKSDAEGLLIEHRNGVAKVLFFDLNPEIRDQYDFDPIEAMRVYRETREADRAIRKQRLLEAEKYRAQLAREAAVKELQLVAEKEWIPVEARIISVEDDIAYATVKKVVFKPTTVISSLGFENPGPPERTTEPFGDEAFYLRSPGPEFERGTWEGYLEPFPTGQKPHPSKKDKSVPVHLAVPPP